MQTTDNIHVEEFRHLTADQPLGRMSCWFRILARENFPFVVLCSQRGNRGVSICNAHEFYREQLNRILANKRARDYGVISRNNVATIDSFWKSTLLSLIDILTRMFFKSHVYSRFDRNSLWFEHWPADRTRSNREEYWVVRLDDEMSPKFSETTLEEISITTGYTQNEILFSFQQTDHSDV